MFFCLNISAQSVQSGVVLEYQGEKAKTPMAGVAITATGAASTMSGDDGTFTLNFRTLKPGDPISFKRIAKVGYELMNREAVEMARVARDNSKPRSPEASMQIILCQASLLNKIRDGYRTVAAQRYEKQMRDKEAEINRLKAEGKLREEVYNARLDSLEQAFESQLQNMETYIDRFARIDLSELDETEKEIIALVQDGRIDEAIQRYDDMQLTEKLRRNASERQALKKAHDMVGEAEQRKAEEAEAIKNSMERQQEILKQKQ